MPAKPWRRVNARRTKVVQIVGTLVIVICFPELISMAVVRYRQCILPGEEHRRF